MLCDIKKEYGFKGLRVKIYETINIPSDVRKTNVELWQIERDGYYHNLGTLKMPTEYIRAADIVDTLNKNYNVTGTNINNNTDILVLEKPQEALDWLISLAMIYELAVY